MQRHIRNPILIASRGLDPVGTGRQVELVACGLRDAGRDVHVAVTSVGGSLAERLRACGVSVHVVGRRPSPDVAAAIRFVGLARRLRPGVAVSFGGRQQGMVAAVGLVVPRVRTVAHVGVPPRSPRACRVLRRMDRVVAASEGVAEGCRRAGLAAGRTMVVPPGTVADPGTGLARVEVATRLGLDPACRWTLSVADLVGESRLERLIWGIDQLGVVRKDLQHVLVGAGPQLTRVRRRARVQELAERLFVVPHCDIISDLVREAAMVWQSGRSACGGVILDAMAVGVPAVAVASDAARQLIVSGETGWVVPSVPESEFPRRAFTLLEDASLAERCAVAARQRAIEAFPADRMVSGVIAAIDGVA